MTGKLLQRKPTKVNLKVIETNVTIELCCCGVEKEHVQDIKTDFAKFE